MIVAGLMVLWDRKVSCPCNTKTINHVFWHQPTWLRKETEVRLTVEPIPWKKHGRSNFSLSVASSVILHSVHYTFTSICKKQYITNWTRTTMANRDSIQNFTTVAINCPRWHNTMSRLLRSPFWQLSTIAVSSDHGVAMHRQTCAEGGRLFAAIKI